MQHEAITTDEHLRQFCEKLTESDIIGFDTEFVSESTYRPQLCLVQVAAGDHLAVIDPLAVEDMTPFWDALAAPGHITIVHAGREEFRFSGRAIGKRPSGWFDIQIAAALIGLEYPAAYSTLISKLLGENLKKGETRTDWRRRPLSDRQIEYALQDVIYLHPLQRLLQAKLDELGRLDWLSFELNVWQDKVESHDTREPWRRVSGISGLSTRSLAIVREVWRWRESEAERRDRPPRRVLRDDLIVELARRATADEKRMSSLRGLDRGDLKRFLPDIAAAIKVALALSKDELPTVKRRSPPRELNVLGQFLHTALGSICRSANVAPSLVGTVQDVHDLIAFQLQLPSAGHDGTPALAEGWRGEVVGNRINDLLEGRVAIRVQDPRSNEPLAFDPVDR